MRAGVPRKMTVQMHSGGRPPQEEASGQPMEVLMTKRKKKLISKVSKKGYDRELRTKTSEMIPHPDRVCHLAGPLFEPVEIRDLGGGAGII